MSSNTLELGDIKAKSLFYLPKEGLQGEDIPSYILWENFDVQTIQISFQEPLKIKNVFNAESYEVRGNNIIINGLELEGYVGLSFETKKVSDLEATISVSYTLHLQDGNIIEEKKSIALFRPQLIVEVDKNRRIIVNPTTGFVKGRIHIKNIGKGTLLLVISAPEDNAVKIQIPPEHREFAEKFVSDVSLEMKKLAKRFPKFLSIIEEMEEMESTTMTELLQEEQKKLKDNFLQYSNRLAATLASDRDLLEGFVDAYRKAMAKNSGLLDIFRRFVKIYETLVSRNILLINPLDEAILTGEREKIMLRITQTDRVFDKYQEIPISEIFIECSKPIKLPIYKLFSWD